MKKILLTALLVGGWSLGASAQEVPPKELEDNGGPLVEDVPDQAPQNLLALGANPRKVALNR